jgi:glucose-6-phosphate 1-dehydrogenase
MATVDEEQAEGQEEHEDEESNPLVEGLERLPVHPTTMVIFGASGDLAKRKLLPAIYNLAHEGALPERFNLIGVSRGEMSDDEFRDGARDSIKEFSRRDTDEKVLDALLEAFRYVTGSFDDESMYERLGKTLDEFDEDAGIEFNRLFYLSTAPSFFPVIAEALGEHELNTKEGSEVRIIIEKPFGTDLASARELNRRVLAHFDESQVFRIDHYLGKETVQNMLVLRFANGIFEPLWNRSYVDYVQITAAEDLGIGSRAGYYDSSGALRDLIQNHMLQLLMILSMEPPVSFSADEVRDEKVKVLHSIPAPELDDVPNMAVRAQYEAGSSAGEEADGYLDEKDVPDDSTTETYAAVRLMVQNWRWAGVPFYLRTGKRLARKITEIAVTLKPVPHLAFKQQGSLGVEPNQLVLTVQPNEGVSLSLVAKIPGARMAVRPVNMEFLYGTSFMSQSPEAYERLIMDTMRGDATLFARNDEVEAAWAICDPILTAWQESDEELPKYEAGSQGPKEAEKLLLPGHKWRPL